MTAQLTFRRADQDDAEALAAMYDRAAHWMRENGIDQWRPGEKDTEHFLQRMKEGEVWLAEADGHRVGAYELWWDDEEAWGVQPPVAGYVHRLMVDRRYAPAGTGRILLAHAEQRISAAGRERGRLDCAPWLCGYYAGAGYRAVGELPDKKARDGRIYSVTLLERVLG
ncbi:GNAT family N-acetyltransferase [Streptomyces sp. NBC_01387]|uniref:GNAT family N-acetyltransferase n=1 Tax=unclassified Streptomyces TaxID=2593676 RepID=UPI0020247CF8|nr:MULTISPECIES: GNAT family N-acetyltransferase [unclassified Streptomyces]MCX4551506.1 GNAT family N-acetyltransferase [Streptomyces sp. NBC_01500]WSC22891.1 GNAT family N-acetyltransferase [Streptomyces sp. NBC_01766]WSV56802.1 GNAT family N-acetyltransferase [Streptomyces sp. NBC_01014]